MTDCKVVLTYGVRHRESLALKCDFHNTQEDIGTFPSEKDVQQAVKAHEERYQQVIDGIVNVRGKRLHAYKTADGKVWYWKSQKGSGEPILANRKIAATFATVVPAE